MTTGQTLRLLDIPKHPSPEEAQRMMDSLPAFSARRLETEADLSVAKDAAARLKTPATRRWIAGRVMTLLSHYFVAQQDASVVEAVADDWCSMLDGYPAWAIANACRWWMSRENPRKHVKPLPGDIQERAYAELSPVRVAEITIQRGIMKPPPRVERADPPDWWTPESVAHRKQVAAEVMRQFRGETA